MSENFSPFKSEAQPTSAIIANRYELLQLIGQGAMSKVYKGRDSSLGRVVAIKFLREEYNNNPNFVARFQREARAVASLPPDNIVSIYDFGQFNNTYFIVMEYVEGRNLKEMLRQEGPFSPERTLQLVTPVLLALKVAHSQGIIHRDVKPQNILVRREDGAVKLTDFGVAYASDNAQVTSTGMVIGTVDYMAPEQARGEHVGPPADLYAVGIVIFELLTAHLPFTGENTMQIIMGHISKPVPSLASHGISVTPALERLLQRALTKDVHSRFQSAQEMLNAFEMVKSGGAEPQVYSVPTLDALPRATRQPPNSAVTYQPTSVNPVVPPASAAEWPEPAASVYPSPVPQDRPVRVAAAPAAQARRPTQPPPPARKSPLGWLIPVIIGLLVLGVIGWLAFTMLLNTPPVTPTNSPTQTVSAALTTASNGGPTNSAGTTAGVTTSAAASTTTTAPTNAAVTTAPPAVPVSVKFTPAQLNGAYDRDDHTLFGRVEKALYGAGSTYNQGTITFNLDKAPTGKPVLKLSGLDDERSARCNFEVLVNGVSVFNRPNTFPNVPGNDTGVGGSDRYWGDMSIPIPAGTLKAGQNTLVLRNNTAWTGQLGVPYILISNISIDG